MRTAGRMTRLADPSLQNFVLANAIETILTQPKRPVEEPPPTSKKDFGQVPRYLQKIKKEIDKEKKIVAEYVKQQVRGAALCRAGWFVWPAARDFATLARDDRGRRTVLPAFRARRGVLTNERVPSLFPGGGQPDPPHHAGG